METLRLADDRSGLSEAEARDAAAERLGLEVLEEILAGGSSARVYRARDRAGLSIVLKVLVAREGVVDGHDLGSFRRKLDQIERIAAVAPAMGARYLPIRHGLDGPDWSAYTTAWYPSRDLAAPLREPGGEAAFAGQLAAVAGALLAEGYAAETVPAPADHLERTVIGRFLRRLPALERALPEALAADELTVNGRACLAPQHLLPWLLAEAGPRLAAMAPRRLGLCAHGDANTRNILVGAGNAPRHDFRLVDPRGSLEPWDPVYDLAKLLFSLTVWEPALRLGFAIDRTGTAPLAYRVGFRAPLYPGYAQASLRMPALFAALPEVAALLAEDPGWPERLLLTHALHLLAEAPCRLSDRKPRTGADGAPSSPEELALGHYLMGALALDDLARHLMAPGELDAAAHLASLAPAAAQAARSASAVSRSGPCSA